MDINEAEEKTLEHFRNNGFNIVEWPNIHPALEWRPRMSVERVFRGRRSYAAILVRENGRSYKELHNWAPLRETRSQMPDLAIYFVIPNDVNEEPLRTELRELGIGVYKIEQDGSLAIVQADVVPFEDTVISYPIHPERPYRNRQNAYKVFSNCKDYLYWLDKHFLPFGLELLFDWCIHSTPNIKEIKILGSDLVEPGHIRSLQFNIPAFKTELSNMGISVELKILTDRSILGTLHDRYIISNGIAFNVLPCGSLNKGQHGSLNLDDSPPDFMSLWALASNINI